jgi:hypothetical protein
VGEVGAARSRYYADERRARTNVLACTPCAVIGRLNGQARLSVGGPVGDLAGQSVGPTSKTIDEPAESGFPWLLLGWLDWRRLKRMTMPCLRRCRRIPEGWPWRLGALDDGLVRCWGCRGVFVWKAGTRYASVRVGSGLFDYLAVSLPEASGFMSKTSHRYWSAPNSFWVGGRSSASCSWRYLRTRAASLPRSQLVSRCCRDSASLSILQRGRPRGGIRAGRGAGEWWAPLRQRLRRRRPGWG